jgi:hypothetical protein
LIATTNVSFSVTSTSTKSRSERASRATVTARSRISMAGRDVITDRVDAGLYPPLQYAQPQTGALETFYSTTGLAVAMRRPDALLWKPFPLHTYRWLPGGLPDETDGRTPSEGAHDAGTAGSPTSTLLSEPATGGSSHGALARESLATSQLH